MRPFSEGDEVSWFSMKFTVPYNYQQLVLVRDVTAL